MAQRFVLPCASTGMPGNQFTSCHSQPMILPGNIKYFSVFASPCPLLPFKSPYILSNPLWDAVQYTILLTLVWGLCIYNFSAASVGLCRGRQGPVANTRIWNEEYSWSHSTCLFCLVHSACELCYNYILQGPLLAKFPLIYYYYMAIYIDPTVLFPFYCKDIKAGNLPKVQNGD